MANQPNDGNHGEVDLFELSRRIEQAEKIHRSIDGEYRPAHIRRRTEAVPNQTDTADGQAKSVTNAAPAASSASNPSQPTGNRASAAPKTVVSAAKSTVSAQKALISSSAAVKKTNPVPKSAVKRTVSKKNGTNVNQFVKFLLIAAGVCVIMGLVLFNGAADRMNYVAIDTDWSDVKAEAAPDWALRSDPDVTNILLLGIDGDGGENQRSDTIMILTLDGRQDVIKMTSILRDTYVWIPERKSKTRINHAYAYGGAGLTMRTVESNFRIDLERYIGIDMDGLTVVADKLGGVDMELTKAEANVINKHVKNSALTEGVQHLNGAQATYYARIRKIDSDFGRTGRQRKLLRAMLAEFRKRNVVEQYSLVAEAAPYLTTNYSKSELLSVALKAVGMPDSDMEEMSVPVQGAYQSKTISGMAVLVPDLDKNCRALHQFIFGSLPES